MWQFDYNEDLECSINVCSTDIPKWGAINTHSPLQLQIKQYIQWKKHGYVRLIEIWHTHSRIPKKSSTS